MARATDDAIIDLTDAATAGARTVGGKAWRLGQLLDRGFSVPRGFCIGTGAYREHALRAGAESLWPDRAAVRRALRETELEPRLRERIVSAWRALGAELVAVRSSATTEDQPGRSFAGLHDTQLDVADAGGLEDSVRACWASLWSERACEYRERIGAGEPSAPAAPAAPAEMAVVVQAQVAADAAGVAFGLDPVAGRSDRIVVEAVRGSGEALVSGRATPERHVLSRPMPRVLDAVAPDGASGRILEERDALRIARLVLDVERELGFVPDVEWAREGEDLLIVQARPVTAAGRRAASETFEDRQVWTNANSGEVMPDVVTPLTWSVVSPLLDRLFHCVLSRFGVDLAGAETAGLVAGRVYFNVNTAVGVCRAIPLVTTDELDRILGGMQGRDEGSELLELPDEAIPRIRVRWWRAALGVLGIPLWLLRHSARRGAAFVGVLASGTEAMRAAARNLPDDDRELAEWLGRWGQSEFLAYGNALAYPTVGMAHFQLLDRLCRRWLREGGQTAANALLAGAGGMDSADAGLALWRLSEAARARPAVASAVREAGSFAELRAALDAVEGGDAVRREWDRFMERHGHHVRGEIELRNARWEETPDYVLGLVRGYVESPPDPDPVTRHRRGAEAAAELERSVRRSFRNPLRRLVFRHVLEQARRGAAVRENLKSEAVRQLAVLRRCLLVLGERLATRSVLDEPGDVFFLRLDELPEAASATATDAVDSVRRRVVARRLEFERDQELDPPSVVVGRCLPPGPRDPGADGDGSASSGSRTMEGLAVSPGIVTGPARVILRAGEDNVRPGEVLVAPFTDPGWTPYFLSAAAIVMDMGGLLSHGSIIAREYGIPAVVNVGPATRRVRTGQLVRVDGNRGVVEVISDD